MSTRDRRPSFRSGPWCVVSAWRPELKRLESRLPVQLRRRLSWEAVGVGLVEAAAGAARLLAEHRPAALLLVGTAGVYPGHGRAHPPGSAAVVDEMVLLPNLLPSRCTYVPDLLPLRVRSACDMLQALRDVAHLPLANVACPLAITASARAAATAAQISGCALENLEAFAVARAAAAVRVPFVAVLGVTNHVGPDGHRQWQENAKSAAAAACDALLTLLLSLAEGEPPKPQRSKRPRGSK